MPLTMLLGGARSGKSALAVRRAGAARAPVVLVATGEPRDAEMAARIARHRADRPAEWTTLEEPLELAEALAGAAPQAFVIVDCLSLWVSNLLGRGDDDEAVTALAHTAAGIAAGRAAPTIAVSNEVGMGIVPVNALARRYRDVLGRVNAIWTAAADEAALVVAGRLLSLTEDGLL